MLTVQHLCEQNQKMLAKIYKHNEGTVSDFLFVFW